MECKSILNKYQEICTDILAEVATFCDENKIDYYLAYGTLLGAVRHQNFIPWDDDVDIWMPRVDFERFKVIFPKEGNVILSDGNITDKLFVRVIDLETKIKINNIDGYLWIDIFPLDNLPTENKIMKKHIKKFKRELAVWGLQKNKNNRKKGERLSTLKNVIYKINKIIDILSLIHEESHEKKMINTLIKYNGDMQNDKYYFSYSACYLKNIDKCIFEKKWFKQGRYTTFGKYTFKVPIDAESILRKIYGNYMILPEESKQISLHKIEFSNIKI